MYKTCLHCRYIWLKNTRGRPVFYCRKIFMETGEYFILVLQVRPRRCPLLKRNKIKKEDKMMKEDNGDGHIDRKKLEGGRKEEKVDITAELIRLYQHDPISRSVIKYLLSKYKIIPLNAIESIRLHREEILLNIVNVYRKMWDARGKIMMKAMSTGDKPMKIIIKERGKNEGSDQEEKEAKGNKADGDNKRVDTKEKNRGHINEEDSGGI